MAPDELPVRLPSDHEDRMRRATLSLEGLSLGDAFGERFFLPPALAEALVAQRVLPDPPWHYTDDTVMALSIVETLEIHGAIDQEALARRFSRKYRADPGRGYGGMAHRILREIGEGSQWRRVSSAAFGGMGSMGNGGAMRAAPIGGYFSEDLEAASSEARRSAEVTHAHPEGQAGAAAVAVAAARASRGPSDPREILEAAMTFTPDGETRAGIARASRLPLHSSVRSAVRALGNGSRVISQDTVPFALWCAARHMTHFEEALWTTVSGFGDRDTTCAIVGGIVSLAVGREALPSEWVASRESLAALAEGAI
jgi:ADP-ribosylglycohydrolase